MSASSSKRNRNASKDRRSTEPNNDVIYHKPFKSVQPKNYIQSTYLEAIKNNEIIFGIGSAGTGKTYIAAAYAAEELFNRRVDKIIITRPNVEAGPSLGFLPGELEDKYAPYLEPFADVFRETLGNGFYEYAVKNKQIEAAPIGFMRGRTFNNAIILVDEVQNVDPVCMELILTRIGSNSKMIFSGDTRQKDIQGNSGLSDALRVLEGVRGIEVVNFLSSDNVRSAMSRKITMAYENK
jgi:phosphate starvation-inducible protein PhoH and related proteins